MTAVTRICVAGLLGLWIAGGVAQETTEENTAAAGEAAEEGSAEQPEVIADAGAAAADAGATETVATEPGEAFPEVAPLDELFVPSQNIRADEPVTFPVDF